MKNVVKIMMVLLISLGALYAQDKSDSTSHNMKAHKHMMQNMQGHMDSSMMHKMMNMKDIPDSCKAMMKNMDMNNMPEKCKQMMKKMNMHGKMGNKNMDMNNMDMPMRGMHKGENSLVRKGVINLSTIDKNGDGFVYQDMMDWNVISDSPGECPLCGMNLKKVSLEEARKNLTKHGFKVK